MICVLCYVMCYVFKTLGMRVLVTMNKRMTILGIDSKFELGNKPILINFRINIFLPKCFK